MAAAAAEVLSNNYININNKEYKLVEYFFSKQVLSKVQAIARFSKHRM